MRFSHRTTVALALVLAPLLFAAACGGNGEPEPTPTPAVPPAASYEAAVERGPFAVGVTTVELVDTSRPTAPMGGYEGSDRRKFTVEIWYPASVPADADDRDAPLDAEAAPYPLIIFAHGLASSRNQSLHYTHHLASHGYVVVSPDFPLSGGASPAGPQILDVINQPADVSFIIDSMLEFSEEPGNRFEGAIDAERIGLTGHSLGAFTTLLSLYGPDRDERLRAALPLAGSACLVYLSEESVGDVSVPVLLMAGSEDLIVPAAGSRYSYEIANAPRYWVELIGGNHVRFASLDADDSLFAGAVRNLVGSDSQELAPDAAVAEGLCDVPPPSNGGETISLDRQQELLRLFATPFFDAYLRDSGDARRFLEEELPELITDAARYEFDVE